MRREANRQDRGVSGVLEVPGVSDESGVKDSMAKSKQVTKSNPSLIERMKQEAESRVGERQGGSFPPYLKIIEKSSRSGQSARVVLVDPEQKDSDGRSIETVHETMKLVLLHHVPFAEFKYRDSEGRWHAEAFALGTKKQAISVGRLHEKFGAALPRTQVDALLGQPGGIDARRHQTTFEGTQEFKAVKYSTRHACVFMLAPEHWDEETEEPVLAMAFLPVSSVYGTSIEDKNVPEAEMRDLLRSHTLSAFPVRGEGDGRGILMQMDSRPWELAGGEEAGAASTPTSAVWLTLFGAWLGTPRAVPAFEIGFGEGDDRVTELTLDELEVVEGVLDRGKEMLVDWAARNYTDALPRLDHGRAKALAAAAIDGDFEGLRAQAVAALPEVVQDSEVEDGIGGDDMDDDEPNTNLPFQKPTAKATAIDDEFPDERDLPI